MQLFIILLGGTVSQNLKVGLSLNFVTKTFSYFFKIF